MQHCRTNTTEYRMNANLSSTSIQNIADSIVSAFRTYLENHAFHSDRPDQTSQSQRSDTNDGISIKPIQKLFVSHTDQAKHAHKFTVAHIASATKHTLKNPPLTVSEAFHTLKTPLITKTKCSQRYTLLIMVTTKPERIERRSSIRSTWGSSWHNRTDLPSWKTVFQLGQSEDAKVRKDTAQEAEIHHDMIFGDFQDVFYKLSVKVIMGFEWATTFCDFEFLLKTDDDVSVSIPNTFRFLKEPEIPRVKLYAGNVHFDLKPERERSGQNGKYYVSYEEYPYRRYPRFCSGGGMLFSRDVASGMVDVHNNINYFKLDDVYIGMLALKLGVDAHHEDMFLLHAHDCKCHKKEEGRIVRHGASTRECQEMIYNCTH